MKRNQHIADLGSLLVDQGLRHVIICPGSRNAPLIQLFTENPSFHCRSIVDERSAGYLALGMARQLQQPVGIVTTSGTAVLNLAPAVAEANFQRIPLILFTADRPRESIPQFNNQFINQTEPFIANSKGFYQFPAEVRYDSGLQEMLRAVEAMAREACTPPRGPVHFNIPLDEPLYEPLPIPFFSHFKDSGKDPLKDPLKEPAAKAPDKISPGARILVLAGMGPHGREIPALLEMLMQRHQAVVVAENIANLPSDGFIANPELLMSAAMENELAGLAPDMVIAFGGQVVSKRLKLFLNAHPPDEIRILENNPEESLKCMLEAKVKSGGSASNGGTVYTEDTSSNSYLKTWKTIEKRAMQNAADYLEDAPYSNLTAIHKILTCVPGNAVLHLGNSSIIRYSQLLPLRSDLHYYSNRGTSGIDGTVSSAVGAAMVSREFHLLVVGDLGFVYDSNALWNKDFPDNLRIVVVNDGGGGIFRLLEGPDRMPFFEEFSVTHHPVSLELLTRSFDRGFQRASGLDELEEKLELLWQPGSDVSVLEVDTRGSKNSLIFKEFLNHHHS